MSNVLLPDALRLEKSFQWSAKAIGTALPLLLTVSCTQPRSSQVDLSLKVEPANRPGVYTVSGNTNVPDQTQIIVQGIRPLSAADPASDPAATPNYAILDRQTVAVSQGHWQATLKLWQSKPEGQYQEMWQANRQLGQLQPKPEVIFLAAIDPGNQSKALKQQLEREGKTLEGANVRFTTDEQWYLQAKQTLAVTPPIVKQSASIGQANDSDRTLTLPSTLSAATATSTQVNLPVIKEKQSTAPLSFAQRLR